MQWLAQNWLWILFAVAFFGMHLFGHGGHGAHGGHERHGGRNENERGGGGCCGPRDDRESSDRGDDQPRGTHQH